jgi:caffeoyl-CoA O-methyltransferase
MEFLPSNIEQYAIEHSKSEDPVLAALNRETWAKVLRPRMLSGHLQGKILENFSYMIRPKRILEIGTYTGYSAICMAKGLAEGGKMITIDINDEISHIASKFIEEAGLIDQIDFRIGDALKIIPDLTETWDLVFIDADKENYSAYYDLIVDRMRPGGFIIADNVLWSGKVLDSYESLDNETKSLFDFNNKITNDDRVDNVLMPVRDGLMIIRKK